MTFRVCISDPIDFEASESHYGKLHAENSGQSNAMDPPPHYFDVSFKLVHHVALDNII